MRRIIESAMTRVEVFTSSLMCVIQKTVQCKNRCCSAFFVNLNRLQYFNSIPSYKVVQVPKKEVHRHQRLFLYCNAVGVSRPKSMSLEKKRKLAHEFCNMIVWGFAYVMHITENGIGWTY